MERAAATSVFVGIDVAKDRLDVHVRPSGNAFAVPRDGAGLDHVVADLCRLAPILVVLEATGGFERTVAAALAGAELPLAVVNPRQIRDFARATGRLAKTDRLPTPAMRRSSPSSPSASGPRSGRSPATMPRRWPNWSPAAAKSST